MNRVFLLAVVVGLSACSDPADAPWPADAVDTLRVMVYNIHHGEGMDNVVDLDRIAASIRAQRPHLVALQEMDSVVTRTSGVDQTAVLANLTGLTPVFGRFMAYQGGAYGMAVLSALPVVGSENIRLPNGDEPRSSVVVSVRAPRTGRRLRFASVHFYRTEEERLAQARSLVQALGDAAPVIMAGDFNSTPGSAVMEELALGWTIVDKGADHMTFPSWAPEREIDFVTFRPADAFEVVSHYPLDDSVTSDHRALFGELIWK